MLRLIKAREHANTLAAPLTVNSAQDQRLDGSESSIRRQVEFFYGLLVHLEGEKYSLQASNFSRFLPRGVGGGT